MELLLKRQEVIHQVYTKALMQILTIFLIAVGLAMDAFAVSLAVGTCGQIHDRRGKIRLAAHFGIFQAGMTALGYLIGGTVMEYVKQWDHWIAAFLLGFVAYKLIKSSFNPDCDAFSQDPSKGRTLVLLSVATSLDAFAVGLSIALIGIPVFTSVLAIGMVATLLSGVGVFTGHRLSCQFGKRMELLGGIILILIAAQVLITHLRA